MNGRLTFGTLVSGPAESGVQTCRKRSRRHRCHESGFRSAGVANNINTALFSLDKTGVREKKCTVIRDCGRHTNNSVLFV